MMSTEHGRKAWRAMHENQRMYKQEVVDNTPTIRLETRDGAMVADFCAPVVIMMKPRPEVLQWGERNFVYFSTSDSDAQDKCYTVHHYREVLAFPLIAGGTAQETTKQEKI